MNQQRLWRRAAELAYRRGSLTAGACARHDVPLGALPELLGCDAATAWSVALCRPPDAAWPPERWSEVIARRFNLNEDRVLEVAMLLWPPRSGSR